MFVAGVSHDPVARNAEWGARLRLPYPLLSDLDGECGRALHVLTSLKLGAWTVEFLKRQTLLAGVDGRIARVWTRVHVRGHARDVAEAGVAG